MIVRRLLGLEDTLSMGICGPEHDWRSWTFDLDPGEVDPVLGIHWLREAFEKAVPGYDRGVTVPAIVEVAEGAVVTADYRQITLDLEHEWTAFHRPGAPELYPDKLQDEIEEISAGVYEDVNNGVYKTGFASTQAAYEESYRKLFAQLDALSERLATRRYLAGDTITEADVRLWVTLVRFDPVYHGHFTCNRQKLSEMPVLVGLCPRPLPDPRLRRHGRLRADQAALLRGAPGHQRDRGRAEGPGRGELADPARPGGARRPPVRRRQPARTRARRRAGALAGVVLRGRLHLTNGAFVGTCAANGPFVGRPAGRGPDARGWVPMPHDPRRRAPRHAHPLLAGLLVGLVAAGVVTAVRPA